MALYLCVALVPAIGVSVSRCAEGRFGAPGARITDPTNSADQEPRCEHRTLIGGQQGKPLDDTLGIATGRSLLKAGWPHRHARLDVRTAFLHLARCFSDAAERGAPKPGKGTADE
jgi:hypothetical protein